MMKNCIIDGEPFQAIRPQAKYCSARCRKRAQRGTVVTRPDSVTTGTKPVPPDVTRISPGANPSNSGDPVEHPFITATKKQLETAGVLDTMLGQQALRIATQMSGFETAGGMASLSKELSRVMAEALRAAVSAQTDPVDELQARREAKLAAG